MNQNVTSKNSIFKNLVVTLRAGSHFGHRLVSLKFSLPKQFLAVTY